jgi:hypothetical protein
MTGAARFAELPLGAVRPEGWLRRQLELQARGITGRLPEVWPDVGPDSGWLGGDGEDWERGPYYLDGLVPLAFVLDDAELRAAARPWIEWMLASQRADGQFGPASNDDWWPRMVALKVLTQWADATGDERVVPFIERYAAYQREHLPRRPLVSWGAVRGAEAALALWWLHDRRPDSAVADVAAELERQTLDWHTWLTERLVEGRAPRFAHETHGPNVAMGLRAEAAWFLRDGDERRRARPRQQLARLRELHGQAHGWFSGDEWLGGREATQGVETCQVVESMLSASTNLRVFGDAEWGDELELLAYNLLPASSDPGMRAHQYLQQANQIGVGVAHRGWSFSTDDANVFGLEPHFGCCTANLHQGWPKLVRALWLADGDGLAAMSYAPCRVSGTIGGEPVELDVATEYPFEETVRITVRTAGATGRIALRIPGWCSGPRIRVGSDEVDAAPAEGFVALVRDWRDGDVIELTLPQEPRTVERDRGAVAVRLGPLVMVRSLGEDWWSVPDAPGLGEWHLTPRTNWNLGIVLDGPRGRAAWRVRRRPVAAMPFHRADPPVEIDVLTGQIPGWRTAEADPPPPPPSPDRTWLVVEPDRLVPYATARLRMTELPVLDPKE